MTVDERIQAALDADECAGPATLLAALVYSLRAEGMSKQAIGAAFDAACKRERNEALAEIVDALSGACSPAARLLPDEPDVTL